jgi:hypothetical protein
MKPTDVYCDVYLGRKLVFSKAQVNLDYKAEYDEITIREEDLGPSITRITSERYEIAVNGKPYVYIVTGAKKKHFYPSLRLVKHGNRIALHLTKKYARPSAVKHHYEVEDREAKPLARPHGSTEAKRKREQQ